MARATEKKIRESKKKRNLWPVPSGPSWVYTTMTERKGSQLCILQYLVSPGFEPFSLTHSHSLTHSLTHTHTLPLDVCLLFCLLHSHSLSLSFILERVYNFTFKNHLLLAGRFLNHLFGSEKYHSNEIHLP